MAIEFRVLGPLVVRRDSALVKISSPKQRLLLALLLVQANEVVTVDTLIDGLWNGTPPGSAVGLVHTYVSQLRKALEPSTSAPTGQQTLRRADAGYLLMVDAEHFDADRFEGMLEAGRRALAEQRPHDALGMLDDAAALWRGPVFGEFSHEPALLAEAERLGELHRLALEYRADAAIGLGRHAELIGELEARLRDDPLRERTWAQLMLCLYRSDRQADALGAYQRLRRCLGDELGLEPSAALRKLESDILQQLPSLDWAPSHDEADPSVRGRPPSDVIEESPNEREPAPPRGTVTFLFTDIEGSTRRWERDAARTEGVLAEHDALLAEVMEHHRGYVFSRMRDGVAVAFSRAADAVAAALAAQQQFASERFAADALRVRMGLHTGEAVERDGHYFGPTVNRAARLMAAGHGGQVLLSALTAELVADHLPAGVALVDLAVHRLKDLARPEHVWQLAHPDLVARFAPLRSLDAFRNNLPVQLSPLVGRSDDVRHVVKALDSARLITITGPGGVGKTRLALQVAADASDAYPDGAWFVEFAPTGDEIGVLSTITSVLRMPATGLSGASGLVEHLCEQLQPREALLVFDNCEHVVDIVARFTHTLLGRCPKLAVVATSRELLRIPGEETFALSPLPVPAPDVTDPVAAQTNAAVSLFYDRARAAQPSFLLDQSTASAVVAICRRLDGIPLALELAAARLRVLTVRQIADHLDDCFGVLVGGARTVPRQQTLQATLDWSHDLLTSGEQTALRRLAVFPDWFRLDAAIAVTTGATGVGGGELDVVGQLVDKSLVVVNSTGQEVRYRLLEPVRQYGYRKLTEAGEADLAARRHRDFFMSHAGMSDRRIITSFMVADYANFRAALAWSWERGDIDSSLALVELGSTSRILGLVDGRKWLERVLSVVGAVDRPERAQALVQLALVTHESEQPDEAREKALTEEAVAIADRLDDAELWARLAYPLAELNLAWGRPQEARATLLRGVSFFSEIDARISEGWCHDLLGWVDVTEGKFERARTHFGRAADLAQDGDDGGWLAAHALADLAPVTVLLGDAEEGSELARRALAAAAAVGVVSAMLMALERAVETALLAGDVVVAAVHVAELLRLLRGQHGRRWVADALENAALVFDAQGSTERAASLLAAARDVRVTSGERLGGTRSLAARVQDLARRVLPSSQTHKGPEDAVDDALTWLQ
jgi:predicted ATPase/DNA-binding SARP family transcriptional activator/class 3 adenylate cyclase